MEIQLCSAKVLHALAAFAPPNSIRPQIHGVWVENSNAGLILVVTDGSALAALRLGDMAPCESFNILIPVSAIRNMPKNQEDAFLTIGQPAKNLGIKVGARTSYWLDEELLMGHWRRVVPSTVSHQPAQFDVALLQKFSALALALGRGKDVAGWMRIAYNGEAAARVHIPDLPDFVGALMPLRAKATALADDHRFTPDWAHVTPPEPELV